MEHKENINDTDIQLLIGRVLRTGVWTSVAVVLLGGVIYLIHSGNDIAHYSKFAGEPDMARSASELISNIILLNGRSIVQAGLILLIATPILRVACSAFGFFLEKDYLYTGITVLVLVIILSSMLTGYAG